MPDGYRFGVISNESDPFCNDCNRLRLDSYGNVFGCLSNNTAINLSQCIDQPLQIRLHLKEALTHKKMKFSGSKLSMLAIGG
jgi:GTP 3',8-cyclase